MKIRTAPYLPLMAFLVLALGASELSAQHPLPIDLKGYDAGGNVVTITPDSNSTVPYSPKATCSGCHDYDLISQSFHVAQGKSEIDDDYGQSHGRPDFVLSPGMFGGW